MSELIRKAIEKSLLFKKKPHLAPKATPVADPANWEDAKSKLREILRANGGKPGPWLDDNGQMRLLSAAKLTAEGHSMKNLSRKLAKLREFRSYYPDPYGNPYGKDFREEQAKERRHGLIKAGLVGAGLLGGGALVGRGLFKAGIGAAARRADDLEREISTLRAAKSAVAAPVSAPKGKVVAPKSVKSKPASAPPPPAPVAPPPAPAPIQPSPSAADKSIKVAAQKSKIAPEAAVVDNLAKSGAISEADAAAEVQERLASLPSKPPRKLTPAQLRKAQQAERRAKAAGNAAPASPAAPAKPVEAATNASEGLRQIARKQTTEGVAGEAKSRAAEAVSAKGARDVAKVNATIAAEADDFAKEIGGTAKKAKSSAPKKEYWTSPDGKTTAPLLGKTPDERASEIAAYNKLHADGGIKGAKPSKPSKKAKNVAPLSRADKLAAQVKARREKKKGNKKALAAALRGIRYFNFQTDEGGIPFTGKVAKDRFIKKLRDEDLDRRDANILRAGGAGALAGLMFRGRLSRGKRALIGAGIGGVGVIGTRTATDSTRDIYGERSRGAKRAEAVPALAGLGTAAWLGVRRLKGLSAKINRRSFKEFCAVRYFEKNNKREKRGLNPYVGAALSGFGSGAALGSLALLKRGASFRSAAKTAGKLGLASAGIVGGGALLGSKIVGDPRSEESAPFMKRAAIGGSLVGAGAGLAGALLLRKTKGGARALVAASKKTEPFSRPAMWLRKTPIAGAAGIGALGGGIYGGGMGADEGQQVDSIRNLRKDLKKELGRKIRAIKFFGRGDQARWDGGPQDSQFANTPLGWATDRPMYTPRRDSQGRVKKDPLTGEALRDRWEANTPQLWNAVARDAAKKRVTVQRGGRLTRDVFDEMRGAPRQRDASGRMKKREWEKSWFQNKATEVGLTVAGLGGLGAVRYAHNNPDTKIGKAYDNTKLGLKTTKDHLAEIGGAIMKTATNITRRRFSAKLKKLRELDAYAEDQGWDVRDPRGRSARVFAPGSRRRERRPKEWHEKTENERKLWKAGLLASAVGGGVLTIAGSRLVSGKSLVPSRFLPKKPVKPVIRPASGTPFGVVDAA
jgi:hypothetical protein